MTLEEILREHGRNDKQVTYILSWQQSKRVSDEETLQWVGILDTPPEDDDDIGPPDTDVPMTFVEMAAALRALGTPCEEPCRPLPFDPDDEPVK